MSVYYYLYSATDKECINLGCKSKLGDREYEGPIVWFGQERYRLPGKMVDLLIDRFRKAKDGQEVFLLSEGELYDSGDYLGEDDVCTQVGSDEDNAPPLEVYLPELNEIEVINSIKRNTSFKL